MSDLGFLFSPNSQFYNASQTMKQDALNNANKGLQNQTLEAQLPGVHGQSMSLMSKGLVDQAGTQDKIKQNSMEAMSKLSDEHLKQLSQYGEKFGQIGALLDQVPDMYKPEFFKQTAPRFGVSLDDPLVKNLLSNVPPEQFSKALTSIGTGVAGMSANAIKEREKLKIQGENQLAHGAQQGAFQLGVANVQADGRIQQAEIAATAKVKEAEIKTAKAVEIANKKAASLLQRMKPDERWTYLNSIAEAERTDVEQAEFVRLTEDRYNQKVLGRPDTGPAIMTGQQPTTPQQQARDAAASITTPKAPAAPQQKPSSANEAAAVNQWGSYEPDKYEYAIINGKVARRPKQK